MRGCRRWSIEHPEELQATLCKAQESGLKSLRKLWKDEDWLDSKKRRFSLETRKEIVRRWEAGESAAELARVHDATPRSITDMRRPCRWPRGAAAQRRLLHHHDV